MPGPVFSVGGIEGRLSLENKQWSVAVKSAQKDMLGLGKVAGLLNTSIRKLGTGFKAVSRSVVNFSQTTGRLAASMSRIGTTAVVAGGLMLGALVGPVKAYAEFQTQLNFVNTMLSDQAEHLLPALGDEMSKMAVEFGEGTASITRGMFDILSASVDVKDSMDVLRVSMTAARAGFSSTAVAGDAITTMLNSFQLEASRAMDVSDLLFAIVARGKTTFEQLGPAIGRVASSVKVAKVDMEIFAATIATVTRGGVSTREAITGLRAILKSISSPATDAAKAAAELGLRLDATSLEGQGLVNVLQQLEGIDVTTLRRLFPEEEAFSAIAVLLGDIPGFLTDIDIATNRSGKTMAAFEKAATGVAFQFARAKEGALLIARAIGKTLAPATERIANLFADWAANSDALFSEERMRLIGTITFNIVRMGVALIGVGVALKSISILLKIVSFATNKWLLSLSAVAVAGFILHKSLQKALGEGFLSAMVLTGAFDIFAKSLRITLATVLAIGNGLAFIARRLPGNIAEKRAITPITSQIFAAKRERFRAEQFGTAKEEAKWALKILHLEQQRTEVANQFRLDKAADQDLWRKQQKQLQAMVDGKFDAGLSSKSLFGFDVSKEIQSTVQSAVEGLKETLAEEAPAMNDALLLLFDAEAFARGWDTESKKLFDAWESQLEKRKDVLIDTNDEAGASSEDLETSIEESMEGASDSIGSFASDTDKHLNSVMAKFQETAASIRGSMESIKLPTLPGETSGSSAPEGAAPITSSGPGAVAPITVITVFNEDDLAERLMATPKGGRTIIQRVMAGFEPGGDNRKGLDIAD